VKCARRCLRRYSRDTRRLLEPLGYVPPDEFEHAYYRHQTAIVELATLT
jgi:hypothetical protein